MKTVDDASRKGPCPLCSERTTLPLWIVQARADALGMLLPRLARLTTEELHAVWFDTDTHVIRATLLARGSYLKAAISARELCRAALRANAHFVIIGHSHPGSSHVNASEADLNVTATLRDALLSVEISLIDHLIVGRNGTWAWIGVQHAPKGWKRRLARLEKKQKSKK